jgi:hypothetical protein
MQTDAAVFRSIPSSYPLPVAEAPTPLLPGYVPGMPRPMTPRDANFDLDEFPTTSSSTPRDTSPRIPGTDRATSAFFPSQANQGQPYPRFQTTLPQGQIRNYSTPLSYSRPRANGQNNSVGVSERPQAGSGGPSAGPAPTAMPSPRMTPHPPSAPPTGLPPHPASWLSYYVRVILFDDVSTFDMSIS